MTQRGPEGSGHPADRTSLPCRLLVCLHDRNGHRLFGHWWLGLVSPVRFLLAGSQLRKAGKQQAVPRARTKLGIFHKLLVRYFKKATQEQLPHVHVRCRTLVITVDVLLPLRLLQNSITRKLELEMSGHCKYKHRGCTHVMSTAGARGLFLPGAGYCWERRLGFCAHFRSGEWLS